MRRPDNFEGSFPLLLIGSVLVVYAGILASQEFGARSGHLPLWGLLGGVGAVIVGAGVYSTFLEPVEAPAPGFSKSTLAPARARAGASTPSASYRSRPPAVVDSTPVPSEGAPAPRRRVPWPTPTTGVGDAATTRAPAASPSPPPRRPRIAESVVLPRAGGRRSLKELTDEISELETLVFGLSDAPRTEAKAGTTSARVSGPACVDCDRALPGGTPPARCSSCRRALCEDCESSSRSEDGEVRCLTCRAQDRPTDA